MKKEKCIINEINKIVSNYFHENEIVNLMNYGNDSNEGLYSLSNLYKEIMDELNIKYEYVYTEDGTSDGKYITVISFNNENRIQIETKAWNGIDIIAKNIEIIYKYYYILTNQNSIKTS